MVNKNIKALVDIFVELDNPEEVHDFLKGLFTPGELKALTQRLEIVKMLKKGLPQRVVANVVRVGIGTVSRGAKELKKGRFKAVKV
jgi:TrpR family transcriptional regulator, trp operon repressor